MREIKFRAWDKDTNRMMQVTRLDFPEWTACIGEDNPKNVDEYYIPERNSFKNEVTDRFILMQFTGFKDKNDKKEVYPGDICRVLFGEQELIYVCEWYDEIGAWVFRGNGEWLMWEDVFETCEIIGNIYQHPELLGK